MVRPTVEFLFGFLEIMDCANRHGANTVPLNDCDISLLSTTSGLILAR